MTIMFNLVTSSTIFTKKEAVL